MKPDQYFAELKALLLRHGDPETAAGQVRYMRHQFDFMGLKAPKWVALSKDFFKRHGLFDGEELKIFARLCMEDEYREMNYLGLQMVEKQLKKQPEGFIDFLEELARTRSWWDTVDWLGKLVGLHFQRYRQLTAPVTAHWMDTGNIWLQRICLVFQLRYREKTDGALLFRFVKRLARTDEFFLQKGAGWALRQYSKTDGEAVRQFVESHPQLSPLTKREALKWLKKQGQ